MEVRANRLAASHHSTRITSGSNNILGISIPDAAGGTSAAATNATSTAAKARTKVERYAAILERSAELIVGLSDRIFATDQEGASRFGSN